MSEVEPNTPDREVLADAVRQILFADLAFIAGQLCIRLDNGDWRPFHSYTSAEPAVQNSMPWRLQRTDGGTRRFTDAGFVACSLLMEMARMDTPDTPPYQSTKVIHNAIPVVDISRSPDAVPWRVTVHHGLAPITEHTASTMAYAACLAVKAIAEREQRVGAAEAEGKEATDATE